MQPLLSPTAGRRLNAATGAKSESQTGPDRACALIMVLGTMMFVDKSAERHAGYTKKTVNVASQLLRLCEWLYTLNRLIFVNLLYLERQCD